MFFHLRDFSGKTISTGFAHQKSVSGGRWRWIAVCCLLLFPFSAHSATGNGIRSVARDKYGVTLTLQTGVMRVEVCTSEIIHVVVSPDQSIPPQIVPVVVHTWTPVHFTLLNDPAGVHIETGTLRINVARETSAVTYEDRSGQRILQEAENGRTLTPEIVLDKKTWAVGDSFISPPAEALYGLGQRQEGWFNLRGTALRLKQINTQIAVPFMLSNQGYGLLWDNPSVTDFNPAREEIPLDAATGKGTFTSGDAGDYGFHIESTKRDQLTLAVNNTFLIDGRKSSTAPYMEDGQIHLAAHTPYEIVAHGGEASVKVFVRRPAATTEFLSRAGQAIDYYFFYGPGPNQVIAGYRLATGEAPLFPKWAYGYWQCRERYSSQQQILDIAGQFRERKIPVDVIVQDWRYWGDYGWNAMKFDFHYPQPAEMIRQLHDEHFHFAISVWPRFGPETDINKEMTARSLLLRGSLYMDIFNPETSRMFWSDMDRALFHIGVDSWWLDSSEPEPDPLTGVDTFIGPGDTVHNAYPLYLTQAVYDGQRSETTEKRVTILTRSAFAGQQRNAAISWSGDIKGNWDTFRRQIPAGLNFSMSGLPYWTTDIGGFNRPADQYTSEAYHELLIRWFEYGSFCPIFRIHGSGTTTELWNFGPTVEGILRKYDALRYLLLPYIYSSAWEVTHHSATLMRGLPMDYRTDPNVAGIGDQFMFGNALLVSPVNEAGAVTRSIYLPQGSAWINFWTGESVAGGQRLQTAAPLETIPLYVKAGSIVPLGPPVQYAAQSTDPIELRVYGGADGSFVVYEDEGDSYRYEQGDYSTIPIAWNESSKTLTIGSRSGKFNGMVKNHKFRIVWVRPQAGVGAELSAKADLEVEYTGKSLRVKAPKSLESIP